MKNDTKIDPYFLDIPISDKILRDAIYQAFNGKCFYTGQPVAKEAMSIDHAVPISKGGKDSILNYVLTSRYLNTSKGNNLDLDQITPLLYLISSVFAPRVIGIYRKAVDTNIKKRNCKKPADKQYNENQISLPTYYFYCKKTDLTYGNSAVGPIEIQSLLKKAVSIAEKDGQYSCFPKNKYYSFCKNISYLSCEKKGVVSCHVASFICCRKWVLLDFSKMWMEKNNIPKKINDTAKFIHDKISSEILSPPVLLYAFESFSKLHLYNKPANTPTS